MKTPEETSKRLSEIALELRDLMPPGIAVEIYVSSVEFSIKMLGHGIDSGKVYHRVHGPWKAQTKN